jgi:DNA replication protein DnaC
MNTDRIQEIMESTGLDYETARQIVEQQNRPNTGNGNMARIGPEDLALWKDATPTEEPARPPGQLPLYKRLDALKAQRNQPPTTMKPSLPPPANESPVPRRGAVEPPAPPPACTRCRDAGYLIADARIGDPSFGKLVPCSCRTEAQHARAQQARTLRASALLARLQGDLGRLAACTFESFDHTSPVRIHVTPFDGAPSGPSLPPAGAHATCTIYADRPGGWLYLWGQRGTGKTHLAAAIAQAAAAAGTPTLYASAPRQLDFVKDGFRDRSSSERLEALIEVDLLVLDDLGSEQPTEWAAATLFALLDERYRHDRPTVFTSNLHPDKLGGTANASIAGQYARIADRIAGQCGGGLCLELRGPSYRRR